MKINLYENLILTIFLISVGLIIYFSFVVILIIFYYRKKSVDDFLNKLFKKKGIIKNDIETDKSFIFFLENQIIFYIIVPFLIFLGILITHYKLIKNIFTTFKNEIIYNIIIMSLFSISLTYYIIFYSSNYLYMY